MHPLMSKGFILALAWTFLASGGTVSTPLVRVGRGPAAKIDGNLDDPAWQTCSQLFPFFEAEGSGPATVQTKALLFRTAQKLFIAFRCEEPRIDRLVAHCSDRDSGIWRDDCVEVFLRRPQQRGFYHIIVNSRGTTYEANEKNPEWNPDLEVAVAKTKDAWTVEMAIPWRELGGAPAPGETWRANVCRERKVESELSCWSCTYGNFSKPQRFGEMVFTDPVPRLKRLELSPLLPGANRARLAFAVPPDLVLRVQGKGGKAVILTADHPAGDLVFPVGLSAGEIVLTASIDNTPAWRLTLPCTITPRPHIGVLHTSIDTLTNLLQGLPADSPLRSSLATELADATETAKAFEDAIAQSLRQAKPLDKQTYVKLDAALTAQARKLDHIRWPIWTKNPWLNLARKELPPSTESITQLHFVSLLNEFESGNIIISNLGDSPLRLRLVAGDFQKMSPLPDTNPNLLTNADFETDANRDGMPDAWRRATGAAGGFAFVDTPHTGKALLIDMDTSKNEFTIRQSVPLEANQPYTLQFWAKAEKASPTVRVHVVNNGWTYGPGTPAIGGTHDWQRVQLSFTPPPSARYELVIRKAPGGSGQVWLDEFVLVKGKHVGSAFPGIHPRLSVADWQELRGGGMVADPLIPLNPAGRLDIPPGESRQVWLTLPARNLPPGDYESTLSATPLATIARQGSAPGKTVAIRLHLVPLHLKTSPEFAVYNWDYARDEAMVRDLVEHKVNTFLVSTGIPKPKFTPDGHPDSTIDYADYDRTLRLKMRYARQVGGQILFAYGIVRDFHTFVSKRYGFAFRDERWDRAFRYTVTQWLAHLKTLGLTYDEFCVQVWDEATGTNVDYVVKGGKLLREIDPKVRLVMDGAQSLKEVRRIDPVIDVWIPHLTALTNGKDHVALLRYYKQTGEPVYTYTCSTFMKALSPYGYHRLKPWQAAALGLDGVFYWAYNSWRGDPWNDFDGPIADCGVIYPGADRPIDSRRWEASREGIEDWQIIRLVQHLAKEAGPAANSVPQTIDQAIHEVVTKPENVDRADVWRQRLIRLGVKLAVAKPLTIENLRQTTRQDAVQLAFTTSRPAAGCLLHRIVGTWKWTETSFAADREHRLEFKLPPDARGEWLLLAWDAGGRVAYLPMPIK